MKISLDVLAGPHEGLKYQIENHRVFMVGRDPDVQLSLREDSHFSRYHFMLEVNPPECLLQDLDSLNGTFVNGDRVTRVYLKDGDVISGGRTQIQLGILDSDELDTGHHDEQTITTPSASTVNPVRVVSSPRKAKTPHHEPDAFETVPDLPVLPGYEIEKLLGQGSMGMVYLASRQPHNRRYAIKTISPESAVSDRVMNLFLREVSVLAKLRHKRIVRFHEMGAAAGMFYFVMDYVETIDVREYLKVFSDKVRIKACTALMCQVLEGLEYAHSRGYVHRDIKPPNVLVGWRGSKLRAKLADFGLAKNFESSGYSGMTFDGDLIGTCAFMPPEQICNSRDAKPSSDLYAVGATLYWFLTGTFAHDFSQGGNPIKTILENDPIPIRDREAAVPKGLAEVIHTALSRNAGQRFSTASELRTKLLPFSTNKAAK